MPFCVPISKVCVHAYFVCTRVFLCTCISIDVHTASVFCVRIYIVCAYILCAHIYYWVRMNFIVLKLNFTPMQRTVVRHRGRALTNTSNFARKFPHPIVPLLR